VSSMHGNRRNIRRWTLRRLGKAGLLVPNGEGVELWCF